MGNPRVPLSLETTFHIYNHAVGEDRFFREEKNYYFFMIKFMKWIFPVTELLSYCLIPNHFHLLLKIKSKIELEEIFSEKLKIRSGRPHQNRGTIDLLEKLVNEQFSHCFNSFAQAYNKEYDRMGSLFKESFQRKVIDSEDYLRDVICYIHNNPVHHGLVSHPSLWKHSSYNDLFHHLPTIIKRSEVIATFDTIENLEFAHQLRIKCEEPLIEK